MAGRDLSVAPGDLGLSKPAHMAGSFPHTTPPAFGTRPMQDLTWPGRHLPAANSDHGTLDLNDLGQRGGGGTNKRLVCAIVAMVGFYLGSAVIGLPQTGTAMITAAAAHDTFSNDTGADDHAVHAPYMPPYLTVLPFVLLLGAIAVLPL